MEDASHRCLRDTKPFEAREHIANATCAPLGIVFSHRHDLVARQRLFDAALGLLDRHATGLQPQGLHAAGLEQPHELLHHGDRDAERDGHVSLAGPSHHRLDDADSRLERHRTVPLDALFGCLLSLLLRHLSSPRASQIQGAEDDDLSGCQSPVR